MTDRYFKVDPWKIIEEGFDPFHGRAAESVFSLANGFMGLRGYFEEGYSGDSLLGISKSRGVPLEAILDANDIQSDIITVGTVLFVPGARMRREDLRLALGELLIYPVRGARLSSGFGWRLDPFGSGVRQIHRGIDLSAPQGTPVVAAMEGRVSDVGFDRTYGNYVIITHPDNFQTLYAHLHTVSVRKDERVAQGARIGTVGNTGHSTGPHLHFGVYRNGRDVNPLDFLTSRN